MQPFLIQVHVALKFQNEHIYFSVVFNLKKNAQIFNRNSIFYTLLKSSL